MHRLTALCCVGVFAATATAVARQPADPLPSWADGETKRAIVSFVEGVTDEESDGYVPPAERVATFDNDGTLWAEQPAYFQALFAMDRAKAMAEADPNMAAQEPFKTLLADGPKAVTAQGKEALVKIVVASHANMTAEEFAASARDWLQTARHPTLDRPFTSLVYLPQLELLEYLRANGFKTFIVSGGGIDFLRTFAEEAYGIPPEQVVGSNIAATYELRDGVPVIVKQPKLELIDDGTGKPVGIYQHIGRRPILAFGNSDGDFQMLEYTTAARGDEDRTPRLGLILHHDDADREFAYDRDSSIGRLDKALDAAPTNGWVVVSMKRDWNAVFPLSKSDRPAAGLAPPR